MAFPLMNLEKIIIVNKVLKVSEEKGLWSLDSNQTDGVIAQLRSPPGEPLACPIE